MSDAPGDDDTSQRHIGMEERARPQEASLAGLPVWVWAALGVLLVAGAIYVGVMIALGVGTQSNPEAATPAEEMRPVDLFVAGFYDALSYHDYVYASTLVAQPLSARYDPVALRARWEAFEDNKGRVVVLAPQGAGEDTVVQRLRTGDGITYEIRVTVERVDGGWRITAAEPDLVPAR